MFVGEINPKRNDYYRRWRDEIYKMSVVYREKQITLTLVLYHEIPMNMRIFPSMNFRKKSNFLSLRGGVSSRSAFQSVTFSLNSYCFRC